MLRSSIPSPIAKYGRSKISKKDSDTIAVPYQDESPRRLLDRYGANPSSFRQFMEDNRLGSYFDIPRGTMVKVRPVRK